MKLSFLGRFFFILCVSNKGHIELPDFDNLEPPDTFLSPAGVRSHLKADEAIHGSAVAKTQRVVWSLVMSRILNRVNRQIVERTLEVLEVAPQHHVLDIGFGGGSAIALLSRRVSEGLVAGVDFSPQMVHNAERNFRREIADGRVQVLLGDVARLPFPDAAFDRALTINTIYFWPDTLQGLAEIRRVLKPGGIAAISIRSREKMQKHGVTQYDFRLFEPQDVADLMRQAGFRDIRVEHRDRAKWYDQGIITGSK